jgi:y4mF family transcriptional regulator
VRGLTSSDIGKEIRRARKTQGLRQEDLAGLAGVGARFVVEVERGKETAQLGRVLQLLAVLGCDLSLRFPGETKGERP